MESMRKRIKTELVSIERKCQGQSDSILPILFNKALEKVVREATLDKEGVRLEENNIGILVNADDIVLMAESKYKLKEKS